MKISTPFKHTLSLDLLIDYWRKMSADEECTATSYAHKILSETESIPELNGVITDVNVFQKHKALMDSLMMPVFAESYMNTDLRGVMPPFNFKPFYFTERFKVLLNAEGEIDYSKINLGSEAFQIGASMSAYAVLMAKHYKVDMRLIYPLIIEITDETTGLKRYYKINMDDRFTQLRVHGTPPEMTPEKLKLVSENMTSSDVWKEVIPSEYFEFYGFILVHAFEVTEQEVLSLMRNDLLKEGALLSEAGMNSFERKIQNFLRNPNMRVGITLARPNKNFTLDDSVDVSHSLLNCGCKDECRTYENSIYHYGLNSDKPVIVYDLENYPQSTQIESFLLNRGIRNILLKSLRDQDGQVIGVLEIGSSNPGDINSINALKLLEVTPLISMAVERHNLDMNNRVQSIIKEKCTAIHPVVEWRFREAAVNLIEKSRTDEFAEMEEIVFTDVYPLHGVSDIRDSSVIRNQSIMMDLSENLTLAKNILQSAVFVKHMPILDQTIYRTDKRLEQLSSGLSSGDEASIYNFIKNEVESLFPKLESFDKSVKNAIEHYKNEIDDTHKIVFKRRKDYEESVSKLNDTISIYIDEQQEFAQSMFPHYFEKYKTDGVEHSMYIGNSMTDREQFDPIYLRNLRLWQLIVMANSAMLSSRIKPKLKISVDTAHLVLVQNTPLSISFHYDEKKFDVDGTYNVRYEIMKKRIDKAVIKGTEVRLTQPGKIAIIYSQNVEEQEYSQYLDYLSYRNIITKEIEKLELGELQGVSGLRALRVTVNENMEESKLNTEKEIEKAVKELTKVLG